MGNDDFVVSQLKVLNTERKQVTEKTAGQGRAEQRSAAQSRAAAAQEMKRQQELGLCIRMSS